MLNLPSPHLPAGLPSCRGNRLSPSPRRELLRPWHTLPPGQRPPPHPSRWASSCPRTLLPQDPVARVPAPGRSSPSGLSSHTVPGCAVRDRTTSACPRRRSTPPTSLPTHRLSPPPAWIESFRALAPLHQSSQGSHRRDIHRARPLGHAPRRRHHAARAGWPRTRPKPPASELLSGSQAIIDVQAPLSIVGNAISVIGDSHSSAPAVAPAPGGAPCCTCTGSHDERRRRHRVGDAGDRTDHGPGERHRQRHLRHRGQPIHRRDRRRGGNHPDGAGRSHHRRRRHPRPHPGDRTDRCACQRHRQRHLVIGDSRSTGATGGAAGTTPTGPAAVTNGEDSILGGTQVLAPITVP